MNETEETPATADLVIATVAEFFAHAQALELGMVERYEEMADSMEVHNNPAVAEMFRELAATGQKHAGRIVERSRGMELPRIAPWDFKWGDGAGPETASSDDVHYLMTPYHALELARDAGRGAQRFYSRVSEHAPDPEVSKIAAEFAKEEANHVKMLNQWIKDHPKPKDGWDYDPDPPGMPE